MDCAGHQATSPVYPDRRPNSVESFYTTRKATAKAFAELLFLCMLMCIVTHAAHACLPKYPRLITVLGFALGTTYEDGRPGRHLRQ